MTLELVVTAEGSLQTACHGCWPLVRSPFGPAGTEKWHACTTPRQLDHVRSLGPWAALICHLCYRSLVIRR